MMRPHRLVCRSSFRGSALALSAIFATLLASGCGSSGGGDGSSTGPTAQRWPGVDWEVADPASEGMDAATLDGAREYAFEPLRNTQGVVVVKNGAVVAEWYVPGASAATLATSWSAGKSFGSTLIGIAIDRGDVPGLDVSLADYFPEWRADDRAAITLRDLLEMRSGLRWDENTDVPVFHAATDDQLGAAINRAMAHPAGTRWNYSSADSLLMSGVIERATGRSAGDFAQETLFGPIGLDAEWWTDAAGHTLTYCCVDTTTRDFARFGLLFARAGEWDGKQVVSREWVEQATRPNPEVAFYGLQWWTNVTGLVVNGREVRMFAARGLHDQNVYVFPELDLVVVRNGIYVRIGDEPVRVGGNFLTTLPPISWDDEEFLTPILRSLDATADTAALGGLGAAASATQVDPIEALGLR